MPGSESPRAIARRQPRAGCSRGGYAKTVRHAARKQRIQHGEGGGPRRATEKAFLRCARCGTARLARSAQIPTPWSSVVLGLLRVKILLAWPITTRSYRQIARSTGAPVQAIALLKAPPTSQAASSTATSTRLPRQRSSASAALCRGADRECEQCRAARGWRWMWTRCRFCKGRAIERMIDRHRTRCPPSIASAGVDRFWPVQRKDRKGRKVRQDDESRAFGRALAPLGLDADQSLREAHRVLLRELCVPFRSLR